MEDATVLAQDQKPAPKDYVVFPVPPGFVPPEGTEPGQSFEALARFQYRKGKMILEAIEGHEVHLEAVVTPKTEPTTFENAIESGINTSGEGMG